MRRSLERIRQRRQDPREDGGFTLIELLVVIVILGVLAGIVVFAVQNLTGTSVLAACNSDVKTVETAVETYRAQMNNYPAGVGAPISGSVSTDGEGTGVNAAGAKSGSGSELLTGSEVGTSSTDSNGIPTENVAMNPPVGPWLKDLPQNGSNYYIWVANDGSGDIFVGRGSPTGSPPAATSCAAAGLG